MLDLDKLHNLASITTDRVMRDYPERDKILINIESIIFEAVRQHAKYVHDIEQKYNIKIE